MKRELRLLALMLAAASPVAQTAQAAGPMYAFQQTQMQRDVRDLSPLPGPPREAYLGTDPNDASPQQPPPQAASASVSSTGSKITKKAKSQKTPKVSSQENDNISVYSPSKSSNPGNVLDRIDLNYTGFFNGPSLDAPSGTTYNPFTRGTGPLYIYHTLDMNYHFDRANLVGAELSGKSDLVSGIIPSNGYTPSEPNFTMYDPQFWYKRTGVLRNSYFSTDAQFSIFPAFTHYSYSEMGEYFSAAFDTTWNLKLRDYHWTAYFTTRIRPSVYADLQPGDGYQREWMFLSTGYYVGYNLTPAWQVNLSGVFDCNFFADNTQLLNRGDANDDRIQLELNYFAGRFARIGGYIQTVMTNPTLQDTFVGLDITLNFLTAR